MLNNKVFTNFKMKKMQIINRLLSSKLKKGKTKMFD